jgi:hypothetical protein
LTGKPHSLWPEPGTPGRYKVHCSCMKWEVTGTAEEIRVASRNHDDSPWRNHVVAITNGGRPVDSGR